MKQLPRRSMPMFKLAIWIYWYNHIFSHTQAIGSWPPSNLSNWSLNIHGCIKLKYLLMIVWIVYIDCAISTSLSYMFIKRIILHTKGLDICWSNSWLVWNLSFLLFKLGNFKIIRNWSFQGLLFNCIFQNHF